MTVQSEVMAVARAVRDGNPEAESEARQRLAEAKIKAYVQKTLSAAPPLSDDQIARLAALLKPRRRR
ncbi:hypothetical protein [Mycolicibacterium tokaiense]|uniref:hypothetical protein n=1 Tax=Mycolicibacterium tokaiense TaxID=39695 RepID=UPI000E1B89B2|nr:hypothetical protein [Mycolicibacterium tokaiense]